MSTSKVFVPDEEFVWLSAEVVNDSGSEGN
jgi:hypothetical protein